MFFDQLSRFGAATAIIENGIPVSYVELDQRVEQIKKKLGSRKQLVFILARNTLKTLVSYLGVLRGRHGCMLVNPDIKAHRLQNLIEQFRPGMMLDEGKITEFDNAIAEIAPELALLLSTSGSTGTSKQVALSFDNIQANADAIRQYLPMSATDCAITTLPFYYSYGLSVINSHLLVGGCVVMTQSSVMSREFWQQFEQHNVTTLAGVPHSYDMLIRLGFCRKALPGLRYLTVAGGKLPPEKVTMLADYARSQGAEFFVMYGQTEATARIAFLAPETVIAKPSSIGQSIPGGLITLIDENGQSISQPLISGELIYRGPNVMLGYVQNAQDLAHFTPQDSLHTGDIAYRDEDGDFFISGRLKRFIKLLGHRISLDEVEMFLASEGLDVCCVGDDNKLQVAIIQSVDCDIVKQLIADRLGLNVNLIDLQQIAELPVNQNGKRDYQAVKALFQGQGVPSDAG